MASSSPLRLLNIDTGAYYAGALLWIGVLFLASEVFELLPSSVRGLKVAILIIVLFLVLEALKRASPKLHTTFLRVTAPGNAVLANWISLMLFVHLVALPSAISGVPVSAVIGWLAT